jgi:hypothetical protein
VYKYHLTSLANFRGGIVRVGSLEITYMPLSQTGVVLACRITAGNCRKWEVLD